MSTKIQLRRDTASAWTSANPALAAGEIGYETDTRNIKIGDGTTLWNSLKYQAPFYTGTNSSLATTTLSVDQTGNRVGIGTVSPGNKLSITTTGTGSDGINITNSSNTAYGSLHAQGTTGGVSSWANGFVFEGVPTSTGNTVLSAYSNSLVFQTNARNERMRIDSAGSVGIGTASPSQKLDVNGLVTSNRTTAGTFVVSGDGAYTFGTDTKQYVYGKPGNSGNVGIWTTDSSGNTNLRLNVTESGAAVTGALTTSTGLTVASGGLTVTAGGLAVNAGGLVVTTGSVAFPTASLTGASLTANSVALSKLPQSSVPVFLGTPSGTATATDVSALTQAQAQTMLGLPTRSLGAVSVVGVQNDTTQKNASLALGAWAQFELTYAGATTTGVAGHTWLYFVCRQSSSGSALAITIQTGVVTMATIASATGLPTSSSYNFCVCRTA